MGEGVVEVGVVGGAPAPGCDAVPVADPDPAVELGAGPPSCPVLGSGVLVGWCAGAPELGEPLLQFSEEWRPVGVVVRVEGGEHRRRDLELDDRCPASPHPMPAAGAGRSAPGEQDVLESALVVGHHHTPLAVTVSQGERAGVPGEDGPVAGDAAGVLVEPEGGGEPQPHLDAALPDPARAGVGWVERHRGFGRVRQVGEIEDALLRR
ncbi:hypothetical protein [Actinomycetospora sp. NBC_00405]|uniref:hypothetical protein n=1 Tax=Actinomycetospora sp. NBC_00405 TaxID=2975952 RepID=UPI002E230B7C